MTRWLELAKEQCVDLVMEIDLDCDRVSVTFRTASAKYIMIIGFKFIGRKIKSF